MGPSHSRVERSRISVSFASRNSVMAAVTTSRAASSSSDTSLALTGFPGCPRFCSGGRSAGSSRLIPRLAVQESGVAQLALKSPALWPPCLRQLPQGVPQCLLALRAGIDGGFQCCDPRR